MNSSPYDYLLAPGVLDAHFNGNTNMAQPTLTNEILVPGPPPLELSEENKSLNDSCASSTLVDSDSSTDINEISNGISVGIDAAVVCSKVDSRSKSLNEVSQSDVDKIETELINYYDSDIDDKAEASSNSQEPLNQGSNIENFNGLQAQDIVPKVAGRKKIDMKARRYIIDNEEDDNEMDVDIKKVTREDNPLIVANDVNSLLDQFEAYVFKGGVSVPKDKKPEKPALSRIQREKEEKRRRLEVLKEKLKNLRARNNASEMQPRKSKSNRDPTWKPNKRDHSYESKETKSLSKKDERRHSSKSLSPPHKDSKIKVAEEQKKGPSPRSSSHQKPTENGKRKSAERHQPEKSPKIGENAKSTVKPSSIEKKPTEVPKELIGSIKEGIKPRTIKLLDDDSIFNQMFTDNHKKRSTTKKPTKSGANATSKSVGVGTSTNNSKLSPKSVASKTSPNSSFNSSKSATVGTSTTYSFQSRSGSSKPLASVASGASFSGKSDSILSRGSVPAKPLMKSVASGSSYPSRVPTQYAPVENSTNSVLPGTKPVNGTSSYGTSTSRTPSTYVSAATSSRSVQSKPYPSRYGNNPIVIPMRSMPGVAQAISRIAGTSIGSRHCSNVVVPHSACSRLTSNGSAQYGSLATKIPPSFAGRNGVNPSVSNGVKRQEQM